MIKFILTFVAQMFQISNVNILQSFLFILYFIEKQILPSSIYKQLCLWNYGQANDKLSWWQSFWNWRRLDLTNPNRGFNGTNVSEGIHPTKSDISKEYMICRQCFLNHEFTFQDCISSACHDLTIFCLNISDIPITTVNNVYYFWVFHNISRSAEINL